LSARAYVSSSLAQGEKNRCFFSVLPTSYAPKRTVTPSLDSARVDKRGVLSEQFFAIACISSSLAQGEKNRCFCSVLPTSYAPKRRATPSLDSARDDRGCRFQNDTDYLNPFCQFDRHPKLKSHQGLHVGRKTGITNLKSR
jgi:hypothetical protein